MPTRNEGIGHMIGPGSLFINGEEFTGVTLFDTNETLRTREDPNQELWSFTVGARGDIAFSVSSTSSNQYGFVGRNFSIGMTDSKPDPELKDAGDAINDFLHEFEVKKDV